MRLSSLHPGKTIESKDLRNLDHSVDVDRWVFFIICVFGTIIPDEARGLRGFSNISSFVIFKP